MLKPGLILTPPRFGKHQGLVVTSTSRTGSQKPTAIPIRGRGDPQAQIGSVGLLSVSGRPLGHILRPPTESGNKQLQQTSVIGLTNFPVQDPGTSSARAGADPITKAVITVTTNICQMRLIERVFTIHSLPALRHGQPTRRHQSGLFCKRTKIPNTQRLTKEREEKRQHRRAPKQQKQYLSLKFQLTIVPAETMKIKRRRRMKTVSGAASGVPNNCSAQFIDRAFSIDQGHPRTIEKLPKTSAANAKLPEEKMIPF